MGISPKQADLHEVVIISKQPGMLDHAKLCEGRLPGHGAGFGVGGGLLAAAARTSCLLSQGRYKSKAAFCRLSTALPFSTKPINNGPAA